MGLQACDEAEVGLLLDERNISHGDDEAVTINGLNEFSGGEKRPASSVQDRLLAIGKPERSSRFHHLFLLVVHDHRFGTGRQALNNAKKDGMGALEGTAGGHEWKKSFVAFKSLHSAPAACGHNDRSGCLLPHASRSPSNDLRKPIYNSREGM